MLFLFLFFFNDTATTEIYTLSLHDALPIYHARQPLICVTHAEENACHHECGEPRAGRVAEHTCDPRQQVAARSEEHTSELQSRLHLVCRLLLEKKKNTCSRHADSIGAPRRV